jgi:RNA polymerase sigma-70 factor (ECF subfamily)
MKEQAKLNDETLFQLLKQSDARVFESLQKLYSKKLLSIAYYVLNDEDEANDVLQDTFIYLWEKRDSIQISSSFINYIAGAVRFRSIDEFRKRLRQQRRGRDFLKESETTDEIETRFDKEEIEEQEQEAPDLTFVKSELLESIENMRNYNRRTAFKLRYLECRDLTSISEEMGYPEQTIRNWLAQGMKYLRNASQNLHLPNRINRKYPKSKLIQKKTIETQTKQILSN